MNQKWFVARQKKKLGPFTADDLQALAAAKEIQPADMVLQEGATQWAPARSLPWLFPVDIPMATLAPLLAEPESVQAQAGKEREADSDANATQTWAVGASTSAGTRFRILRAHAKGGLGQVYVAHDEEVHREVALKEILEKHADNPESRARFLLEAEITGGLEHPGIVPVYGLGTYADGRPFYAMRFIRGATLKDAIAGFHKAGETENENRTVAFRKLLGRFIDACNAIGYAHSRGVLHRDLKPGNIMLGKYGETLVVDWGLAKSMAHAERTGVTEEQTLRPASGSGIAETLAGSAIGTPAYMSPEQALGRLDLLGPATDVYSLGATLYCLLTGHAPFADKDVPTVLRKVQKGEFLRPRQTNPEVPAPLEAICLKAMALEAGQRYASPRALADDIEHWLADEPVSAYREPGLVKAGRWARKHKPLVSGAAAALLVSLFALAAGAIWLESHRAETARTQTLAQTENVRKRALAEEKIRQGLDQAATSRAAFHGVLKKTGGVHELLNQPARWEAQIKTARADWQRAKDLADQTEGNLDPQLTRLLGELDSKLAVDRADYDLAMRLEAIRLDLLGKTTALMNADGEKEPLRGYREVAQREYPRAFHDAGLAIEPGLQKNLAERIHQSAIREQLLSALEDWAYVAYRRVNPALATRILEVARLADPDPWRDQVRDPANWQKTQTMKRLADQVQDQQAMLARLPPQTLSLMFLLLPKEDELSWLRRAQAAYPTDFWINFHLGVTLMSNKERALEATR